MQTIRIDFLVYFVYAGHQHANQGIATVADEVVSDGAARFMLSHYERVLWPDRTSRHAAPDRWDWSVTLESLRAAQDRHVRYEQLAASLTPEQREAVWSAPGPQAALLRRFVR